MALEFSLFILEWFSCSFLVALPFLYDLNAKFRYYFKFFVFYFLYVWVNLILTTLNVCSALGKSYTSSIPPKLYKFVSRVLNIKWEVKGEDYLNLDTSYVIITNEQNSIDILGMSTIWLQLNGNVTNQEGLRHSSFKYASRLRDMLFTNKIEDCTTLNFSLEIVKEALKKKVNIWFFSEQIHGFKTNAFRLAIKEKIPIIPVIFSQYYFIDTHRKIFDPGNVKIQVLEPLQTGHYSIDDVSVLIEKTETTMKRAFKELSDRVTPPSIEELRQHYGFT